jgi:hydrophobic/amphiphilic exporter-1 (mainly G- bacteria), HAE1 family
VRLKDRKDRPLGVEQVINELRPKVNQIPGLNTFMFNPPPIQVGGRMTKSQYQYTIQGPDIDQLYKYAPILADKMKGIPGLVDVTTDLQLTNPEVNIWIDRDKASILGVTADQIERGLGAAYGSRQISTIYAPTNQYQVILELLPEYRSDPEALQMLYIRSMTTGQLVPINTVAKLTPDVGALTVNHTGQLPSVTVSFNLTPNTPLGAAVDEVNQVARQTLPGNFTTGFQGTAQAFQSSNSGLVLLLILAIAVIYMVLGILYESFIHPITILSALPFAGFGALLTLLIFHVELSLYAFVGIIMLVGLVKKNGIMMIDFAIDAQRTESKPPAEAIYEACVIRFRPIMMTTMAALMGTLPIALGFGAGAESRRPLGLAVVGGLLFSQMLTLYVTPVFYLYMESLRQWLGSRRADEPVAVSEG